MTNNSRRRPQTTVELTSLMDIIFILLMVVLVSQQLSYDKKVEAAQAAAEAEAQYAVMEAQDDRAYAEAETELLKEQLDTYASMEQEIGAITIYVDYTPSDITHRTIRVITGNKETEISLTPDNSGDAWSTLEEKLSQSIEEYDGRPVLIAVNKDRILYRDERSASAVVEKLFDNYSNLYYKSGTVKADE